jgi:hypothetical protein
MGKIISKKLSSTGEVICTVSVFECKISDSVDPDLHAAEPLYNWQIGEAGKFVMDNAVDTPEWHRSLDPASSSWLVFVVAKLPEKKLTEFYLKWGTK